MESRELIQAIMDEDFISAKSMMNDLVMSTVADNIDELRQEVAANLFGCDECEEENISIEEMRGGTPAFHSYMAGGKPLWLLATSSGRASPAGRDYDKDGKVEPAKDEVLGSRINAAVRAGKMSPEQAKRTKSKGKYG
jgi:hypothetical protein